MLSLVARCVLSKKGNSVRFYVEGITGHIICCGFCVFLLILAALSFSVVLIYWNIITGITFGVICLGALIACVIELLVFSASPICIEFTPTEIIKKSMFNKVKKRYGHDEVKEIQIRTFEWRDVLQDRYRRGHVKQREWLHEYGPWVIYIDCLVIDFVGNLNHEIDLIYDSFVYFEKSIDYFIFPYSKKAEAKIRRFTNIPINDIREPKRKQQVKRREERQARRIAKKESSKEYRQQEEQETSITDFDDDPFSKRRKR